MKFVLSLVLVPFLAQAVEIADQSFTASCELQKSSRGVFRGSPFMKLFATPEASQMYSFDSRAEAEEFAGVDEEQAKLYTAKLESKGKKREFATPSIEQTKKTAGSNLVYRIKNKVFQNPAAYRGTGETFEVQAEYRDYDDDYETVYFYVRGYVIKDRGTFTCVVL